MYRFGQILALLKKLERGIKQNVIFGYLLGFDDTPYDTNPSSAGSYQNGTREVPDPNRKVILSADLNRYADYLSEVFGLQIHTEKKTVFMQATIEDLKRNCPKDLDCILSKINKKYEDSLKQQCHMWFFPYLASLVKHSLATVPNAVNYKKTRKRDPDWENDYVIPPDFFDVHKAECCPITIPFTIENDRFGRVFRLVQHEEVEVAGKTSSLNIYAMPFENRKYDIQGLKQLLIRCAGSYALSRARTREMKESDDTQLIAHEAILHLKNRYQDSMSWDKALLNFFLFLFMECGLHAPKIFTSGELKSSDGFIDECGGIYFLNNELGTQLVFGVSAVDMSPSEAMSQIIDCSKSISERFSEIPRMIDASLLSRMFSNNEALSIADLLIPKQEDGIFSQTEKSFGVFVGYEADLADKEMILSKGGYEKYIDEKLQQRMDALKESFPKMVIEKDMFHMRYHIFMLPMNEIGSDLEDLWKELMR